MGINVTQRCDDMLKKTLGNQFLELCVQEAREEVEFVEVATVKDKPSSTQETK